MGALGTRGFMAHMQALGYRPIELERYCASNKIWTTKVKRLRLPDVICALTGIRVEVRAKSDLKIRMSDAPANPDRQWDTGLRDEDLCAFIRCAQENEQWQVSRAPAIFRVKDLRASVGTSKLGPLKSASEGAERDREWPSTVPRQSGIVAEVSPEKILVNLQTGRRQTYQLKGKIAYIRVGECVIGDESIIAATVPSMFHLPAAPKSTWNPLSDVFADSTVDRYAAAKVLPFSNADRSKSKKLLEEAMSKEGEARVALEQAGSAARLGSAQGLEYISNLIWNADSRADLRMESVFILTEIATPEAAMELNRIASTTELSDTELRKAAIWGLGKAGVKSYDQVIEFIADRDEDVALHAISALGDDVSQAQVDRLIALLLTADLRTRAAACAALKVISTEEVVNALLQTASDSSQDKIAWVTATLGGMPPTLVRQALNGHHLLDGVLPLLLLHPHENWIEHKAMAERLEFLLMQNV